MGDEDDSAAPPSSFRLMNFVSQDQLAEARKTRGARVEDGTAQRDRSLYEVLKENKDKKDAEFNERFKHRPPKALDEDETEFLDRLELSRRELERQKSDEEAQQLRSFQAAVMARSSIVHELKETPPVPKVQEERLVGKKNPASRPLAMIIKVKPQRKKQKLDPASSGESLDSIKAHNVDMEKTLDSVKATKGDEFESQIPNTGLSGLVSYSDESEED